jgi:ribonuclease PH
MLERYPRCVIQVVVQIVMADGSVIGTAVNCAVMALMDAGVAMRGLPIASTFVVVGDNMSEVNQSSQNDAISVWVDPTAEEESAEGHAIVVLVTETESDVETDKKPPEIITSFTCGAPMSLLGLVQCTECTEKYNAAMVAFMRMAVERKVQTEVETLWS